MSNKIISLSNNAEYNSSLPLESQEDPKVHEFVDNLIETSSPVEEKENTINPKLQRVTKKTWKDSTNDNFDFIYEITYSYKHPPSSESCFALQKTSNQIIIKNK